MNLAEFIATLERAGLEAQSEEVLDALWLASRQRTLALYPRSDRRDPDTSPTPRDAPPEHETETTTPAPAPSRNTEPMPSTGMEVPTALVYALGNVSSGDRTVKATPVALPAGRALSNQLALTRAMRSLRRPWLSRGASELDEERTAQASAELQAIWPQMIYPVLRPTESRWFDVDVVQEDDPAIELWDESLRDFTQLLRNTGAFRTVRSWRLRLPPGDACSAGAPAGAMIETPAGAVFSSLTLAGRGTRRLIFFASHGSSAHWLDGGYARLLEPWIRNCSTVMLHLMPRERWPHTPLGEPHGICAAEQPGPTAATLRVEPFWWSVPFDPEDPALLPLPAVPLDAAAVDSWAHMQMGRGRRASVFLLDPSLPPGNARLDRPTTKRDFERIIAGLRDASPGAFRLAVYLASSPFTIPVARLVQEVKFGPAGDPSQLAELFLSGLLKAVKPRSDGDDPNTVYYEVEGEASAVLLRSLRGADAELIASELQKLISEHIAAIAGRPFTFQGLVPKSDGSYDLPAWAQPFARVALSLLGLLHNGPGYIDDEFNLAPASVFQDEEPAETAWSDHGQGGSMTARKTIPTLRLPDGWEEQRVQITWLAPAELTLVEGQMPRQAPRRNIVLSLVPTESGSSSVEARDKFLKETQSSVAGLMEIEREDEVAFADGKLGSLIAVEFQATSDTRLRQTHLFRIDEDVLAQLVITVDADAVSDEQETELRNAALSYSPAAD